MKLVTLALFFILLNSAFAKSCEVYGISDSPQKLSCTFAEIQVELSCKNGEYFLNSSRVNMAYHLEVEEGPVPLVFKASSMELTVVIENKFHIQAELIRGKSHREGSCL